MKRGNTYIEFSHDKIQEEARRKKLSEKEYLDSLFSGSYILGVLNFNEIEEKFKGERPEGLCFKFSSRKLMSISTSAEQNSRLFFLKNVCSIEGCENDYCGNGYCVKHNQRFKRNGDPNKTIVSTSDEIKLFLEKIYTYDGDDCLIWPFADSGTNKGYGRIVVDGRPVRINRHVCSYFHGDPVPPKTLAAHNCGNRKCVNPKHLRWATPKENMEDRFLHGTAMFGENHCHTKLTEKEALEIFQSDESTKDIAKKYGVKTYVVIGIKKGTSWKYLPRNKS